jgi:hypothetical protein
MKVFLSVLFLSFFLLSATPAAAPGKPEPFLVGTISLYFTEDGNYSIEYHGGVDPCFVKLFVDELFSPCDTFDLEQYYDEKLEEDLIRWKEITSQKTPTIRTYKTEP